MAVQLEAIAIAIAIAVTILVLVRVIISRKSPPECPNYEAGPTIGNFYYSPGVPRCNDGGFIIPAKPGEIGYLTRKSGPLDGFAALEVEYEITGPIIETATGKPGSIFAYIEHEDNDWTVRNLEDTDQWHRCWSRVSLPTEPGRHSVRVPLESALWYGVWGKSDAAAFDQALRHAARIGLTFGGSRGNGHGVYSDAGARFTVHRMEAV